VFASLSEEDLFETGLGAELAAELRRAFEESPSGEPSEWLHLVESDAMRQLLSDMHLSAAEPVTSAVLEDALKLLRQKRENRSLTDLKSAELSDETRTEFLERLKRLKSSR
jgi:hypothetical protein